MIGELCKGDRVDKAALVASFMGNRPARSLRLAVELNGQDAIAWMTEVVKDETIDERIAKGIDLFSEFYVKYTTPGVALSKQRTATSTDIHVKR